MLHRGTGKINSLSAHFYHSQRMEGTALCTGAGPARVRVESRREGERAVNLHNQFKTMSLAPRTDRSFFSPRPPVWKKSHSWRYINYGRLTQERRRALTIVETAL